MSEKLGAHGHACQVTARKVSCVLAAFEWALLCCVSGCATSGAGLGKEHVDTVVQQFYPAMGAVSVKDLCPEYQAPTVQATKTSDLAKLARPFEAESRIHVGDLLEVSCADLVEEAKRESFQVRVADNGTISLPLLPERLPVGSLTSGEAEHVICTAYAASRLIRRPQVTLRTVEHKTHTIYVIGAVKKPGVYELQPDECDPLRAIAAAEGVTEDAISVVEVRRAARRTSPKPGAPRPPVNVTERPPGAKPQEIEFVSASNGGKSVGEDDIIRFDLKSKDNPPNPSQLVLQNGDIVSVEQKKIKPIYVAGSVNKPGEFPMPTDREIRTLEAIGLAGGVLTLSEPTTALVIRRPKDKAAVVIHVDLAKAARHPEENLRLMEGDVISVVEDGASRSRRAIRTFINLGVSLPVRFPF